VKIPNLVRLLLVRVSHWQRILFVLELQILWMQKGKKNCHSC
jgi:hypothetical protein